MTEWADPVAGIDIVLLADRPELIDDVATLRWRESGRPPESADYGWWRDMTSLEAGRSELLVTWVAVLDGSVAGAVGLRRFDI